MPKNTKSQNPKCACGCGKQTKGRTFLQGHDQRLKGKVLRGETISAEGRAFLKSATGVWKKLQKAA